MEDLGEDRRLQPARPLLDQAKAEVDVAQESPLGGGEEERPAVELARPTGVVQQRRREQEVGPQALVELRGFPAERGDAHGVLEQAAGPGMVPSWVAGRMRSRARKSPSATKASTSSRSPGWAISAARNSKNRPVPRRPPRLGHEPAGSAAPARASGLELEAVAEALDAAEDAHRVPLAEALVEQLDVVPDAGLDLARGIDQLQRQVRAPERVRSRCLRATA